MIIERGSNIGLVVVFTSTNANSHQALWFRVDLLSVSCEMGESRIPSAGLSLKWSDVAGKDSSGPRVWYARLRL